MPVHPARPDSTPDGTPLSGACDNVDRAADGGAAAARHVFLAGNDLPARWRGRERFVIVATGFGSGLNFLAAWRAWRDDPCRCRRLHFVSFAQHPSTPAGLAVAQAAWPEYGDLARELQRHWPPLTPGMHRLHLDDDRVILTLVFADAATRLRTVDAAADAFFLDGFAPARNPEPWSPDMCRALARLAAPGATLAACSIAAGGRAALAEAGFDLDRRPGVAGGGEMIVGRFRLRRPDRHPVPGDRRAVVVGAGLAGCTAAHRLAAAGWQVTVLEQADAPAAGASGNLAGVLRPLPSADDNRLSRLTRAGYLATRALLEELPDVRWSPCGVLHLGREPAHEAQQQRTVAALGWPPEVLQFVNRTEASRRLGWPVNTGGWWFPQGGWVQPSSLCRAALAAFPEWIDLRLLVAVNRLERGETGWRALAADGALLAEAPVLVMASGVAAPRFAQFAWLPQRAARGQVSHLPAAATTPFDVVVCKLGYAMPEVNGFRLAGATLTTHDDDPDQRAADHAENLARLNLMLPGYAAGLDPATLDGRVGFRPLSPDRLPIVGAAPDTDAAGVNRRLHALPRHTGLWCVQGFGARGIVWSALMADLLVSRLEGEPLPIESDLADAVNPGRFLVKAGRGLGGTSIHES